MNTTRSDTTSKWKHPDAPGTSGVYPVKKDKAGRAERRPRAQATGGRERRPRAQATGGRERRPRAQATRGRERRSSTQGRRSNAAAGGRARRRTSRRRRGQAQGRTCRRRLSHVDVKRAARRLSGLTRSAAARRLHGHNDAATIAATTNISRFRSVRDRVEKANGMTVIQAIELNIYTLRKFSPKRRICWAYRSGTHIRPDPGFLRARHGRRRPP
jgi:hypothetical protein